MSATAALSAAAVGAVVAGSHASVPELTAALAVSTGVVALLFGVLRFGFVANFISEPVLKGFIIGLALTIRVGQVPRLFGVSKGDGDFFEQLWHLLSQLGQTQGWTLAVGAGSLAVVFGFRLLAPRIPGEIVVVVASIAVAKAADLGAHGWHWSATSPPASPTSACPRSRSRTTCRWADRLSGSCWSGSRRVSERQRPTPHATTTTSTPAAGLSAGMVVNGSLSKTAVNGTAGARTQLSGLVVAALTVLTLVLLTGTFAYLPEATLAAVVVAALVRLIDLRPMVQLYRSVTGPRRELHGSAAKADLIAAVAAGGGPRLRHVAGTVHRHRDLGDPYRLPGLTAAHHRAGGRPRAPRGVVLDTESVPSVDITAAAMLFDLSDELHHEGIAFVIAREGGRVRDIHSAAQPDRAPLDVHPTVRTALQAWSPTWRRRRRGPTTRRTAADARSGFVAPRRDARLSPCGGRGG